MQRNGVGFPQPSSHLSVVAAAPGVVSWPRRLVLGLEQRNRQHMLSAGWAAVVAGGGRAAGHTGQGWNLQPPPQHQHWALCSCAAPEEHGQTLQSCSPPFLGIWGE